MKIGHRIFFVLCAEFCYKICKSPVTEKRLLAHHRKRLIHLMLLHLKFSSDSECSSVGIVSDITDILILYLSINIKIKYLVLIPRGNKKLSRLVIITKLWNRLGAKLCNAFSDLHAFTGSDYTSIFSGQSKFKGIKLIKKKQKIKTVFASLGQDWLESDDEFETLQEFICRLYCAHTKVTSANGLS